MAPSFSRPLALFALVLAACSTAGTSPVDEERQIEIHTESTVGYMNMGEYDRAIDQAMRGLSLDPDNDRLKLYLARALLMRRGTQDVMRAEQILRELDGTEDFRVPLGLAEVLERKGVAFDQAGRAIASGERFTQAPDPAARGKELSEQALTAWNESLEFYGRANELRPNDLEIVSGLVRVNSLLGNHEQSLVWADAFLATSSTDRSFWEEQLRRPDMSVAEEERIRTNVDRLTSLEGAVLLQASSTTLSLDRREQALAYLSRLLTIDPDLPEAHSRRAQLLMDLERYEEAIAGIDSYLRLAGLPFEHPYVRRAYELRRACEMAIE